MSEKQDISKSKKISKCKMCLRGICRPKVFCTQNCEVHWNSGFRVSLRSLEYNLESKEWYLSQRWEWFE